MYNHYIPQSDGSFRRNSVAEPNRRPPKPPAPPVQKPEPIPKPEPCEPPPAPDPGPPCPPKQPESPLAFLRRLIPKDMDISDLIIIGLLLLLSGEDCDDDLSPLLTIALYFLM